MKFKLFLEYDGTRYSGWQKQQNSKTIQQTISNSILDVFGKSKGKNKFIDLQGSGRTDSGVHAYEQVAHLDCVTDLAPYILKMKINDELPSDINILKIEKTNNNFHARHSAKSRQYIYRISTCRTAFEKKYVWWIKDNLNMEKIISAAKLFEGLNDFKSFADKNNTSESTKVLVDTIAIHTSVNKIYIQIKASHFLWKMVRRTVGILAEVGRGNMNEDNIRSFLRSYSNEPSKYTAPPSGLFLEKVFY